MAEVKVPVIKPHGHSLEKDVDYRAGIMSGIIGAVVTVLLVMFVTLGVEKDFFLLPKLTSELVMPVDVASGVLGIIAGLAILLIFGVIYGLLFAMLHTLLTTSYALGFSLLLGLIYGFGLWFISFLILGPVAGAELAERIGPAIAIPAYLILGLILGLYPELRMGKER